jgi:Fic family protein
MANLNLINPKLLEEVYTIGNKLKNQYSFDLVKKHRIISFLDRAASRHSVDIEGEGIGKGEAIKIAFKNLRLAQEYLVQNCKGKMVDEHLKVAAALINNYESGLMNYRRETSMTRGQDGPLIYVDPGVIPNEMYKFIEQNNSLENSPIERAVHSHFHIARIHPFVDGNGRLARLTQNCILESVGFPPIQIDPKERTPYLYMLERAERSYRENGGSIKPEQSGFYNYLALKLKESLEDILIKLS